MYCGNIRWFLGELTFTPTIAPFFTFCHSWSSSSSLSSIIFFFCCSFLFSSFLLFFSASSASVVVLKFGRQILRTKSPTKTTVLRYYLILLCYGTTKKIFYQIELIPNFVGHNIVPYSTGLTTDHLTKLDSEDSLYCYNVVRSIINS